jgi:pimeloyl-ACP methyl ester carboxylesterase
LITAPTLIIWGQNDKATPLSDGYHMNSRIVGSKFVVIPDAGHSPHLTHSVRVAEEIENWLKS